MSVLSNRNLQLVIAVIILAVTGGSLVGPILPAMIDPLGVSEDTIGLVLSVYTLLAMISTPLLGMCADRVGRKPILVGCTLLFGVGGLGIALSRSFSAILVFRAMQGIGVGGMMNTGVTLIGDLFSGQDRAQAMGYRISFQTIANSIVPAVAGALATLAWFYPFFIYVLAIPAGVLAWVHLDLSDLKRAAQTHDRKAYFARVIKLMGHHRSLWVYFCNFMGFVLLYVLVVYMPILIVNRLGLSTLFAGLAMTFAAGTAALVSSRSGAIMCRFSEYSIVLAGFGACSLALVLLSVPHSYPFLLPCFVIWGCGFGLLLPTLNTAATGLAPSELRAGVVSMFTIMIYLGQTVFPPLFGAILASSYETQLLGKAKPLLFGFNQFLS